MVTIFGFPVQLPPGLEFLAVPATSFVLTLIVWLLIAAFVNFLTGKVLKSLTRHLPGEVEDILLGIFRKPLLIIILVFGISNSAAYLPLHPTFLWVIQRLSYTVLTAILVFILWRLVEDLLKYYGERWASKTESKVDDVLIPVLNIFGPPIFLVAASLVIFPLWGIDVTSVLLGAGVVGLVLGLALQDTLSNVFSGMSLLVEAPFKTGDLVVLPDGKVCEVQKMGIRSTTFYWVDEHSTVIVPNKVLSASTLVNVTRPTAERRAMIDVKVDLNTNLAHAQEQLWRVAYSNPGVLVSDMPQKLVLLKERVADLYRRAENLQRDEPATAKILAEARLYEAALPRLDLEGQVYRQMLNMEESFRHLIRGIMAREGNGLSPEEISEIFCKYVTPADNEVDRTLDLVNQWMVIQDPWLNHSDYWDNRKMWQRRNEAFKLRWEKLKKEIRRPQEKLELRLDDMTKDLINWLETEYKVLPSYWKDPEVTFTGFDGSQAGLRLSFYVDNARLEHAGRMRRVTTEVARHVRELFSDEGIW